MGTRGVADDGVETSTEQHESDREVVERALEDVHEAWEVEIEVVSDQMTVEAGREDYHPNGASMGVVAIDHPKKGGWVVIGAGSKSKWTARYEDALEAAETLAMLTNIYEARRTIKHERPASPSRKAYYMVESMLLDALAANGV